MSKSADIEVSVRTYMDSDKRKYVYNSEVADSEEKIYRYVPREQRMYQFAEGDVGTISDAFIIYASCLMGVASSESIYYFLIALEKTSSDLFLTEIQNKDFIYRRLKEMCRAGFFFRTVYELPYDYINNPDKSSVGISLYTPDIDTVSFVNAKLKKNLNANRWIMAKPFEQLMAWASATFVASTLAVQSKFFEKFKQGWYKTANMGGVYYPAELKFNCNGNEIYVGVFESYLVMNKAIETQDDFEDFLLTKINTIKNYLYYRNRKNKIAAAIIVCQDNEDLDNFGELLTKTNILDNQLNALFFTGEGPIRNLPLDKAFLQVTKEDNVCTFNGAIPVFVSLE